MFLRPGTARRRSSADRQMACCCIRNASRFHVVQLLGWIIAGRLFAKTLAILLQAVVNPAPDCVV